jgi:guanyl-specific ribonuclease Sa
VELTFPKKDCEPNDDCDYGDYRQRKQLYTDSAHDSSHPATGASRRGARRNVYQTGADQQQNSQSAKHSQDHQNDFAEIVSGHY